ncbi:MAG: hypothetical protein FJ311_14530 [Rhodospirillales bacterium]|nr:hypothetical protein [Rhodospirillales bacterium]
MTSVASLAKDARTLTVRVPFTLRKRGGRKLVVAPEGATWGAPHPRVDSTMIKAIARGFRWRKLLETGVYGTIDEIAKAEKINPSYVSRVLRLTLLAPAIVESILDGRQPAEMTLAALMEPFPVGWREQLDAGFRQI